MTTSTILVVDDDPDIRDLFTLYLGVAGYTVVGAADGVSAMALAQRKRPDLILLDLGLPAGDGITVLTRMKRLPALQDVPVIVVTGQDERRDAAIEAAADSFLTKPVAEDALLGAVSRCLGMPAGGTSCQHCGAANHGDLDPATIAAVAEVAARVAAREVTEMFRSGALPQVRS